MRRLLLAALLAVAGPALAGELRAGFGVAALPTPDGGPLAGYGGVFDRTATGALDPPEARALLLEQGELAVAIVTLDVVIARPELRERIERTDAAHDLDALLVVATHTHSGPGGYLEGFLPGRVTSGSFDPAARDGIAAAGGAALAAARTDLASARASAALGSLELARNRRFSDGPRERALPVLRLERAERAPILVFAYGAHPTVLSPRSRAYSADYVGAARARIERAGPRALFLPGPLGDQEPAPASGELWSDSLERQRVQVVEIGERLADAALAVAAGLPAPRDPSLTWRALELEPPAPAPRRFCALWWFSPLVGGVLDRFVADRVTFHALALGDARMVGVPGEPSSELGEAIRAAAPAGSVAFVVAHAGDWLGYAVTPAAWERGGYEACSSLHGPDFGPWIVGSAGRALRSLDP